MEVSMRRIGLAVVLALSISAPFDIEAQQPSTGLPRPAYDRALWALRFWLDSWAGIGRVAVGMARQGFDLQLTRYDERGWRTERMGDMTSAEVPTGPFTCEIVLQRVRAPRFILEDRQGVTYMVARDYELTYQTVLNFASGARLPIKAKLVGELNQRVIIRDAQRRPVRYSGYAQGLAEISNTDGHVIFRGRYYDSRTLQPLVGD